MNSKIIYVIIVLALILLILFLSFGQNLTKPSYLNITGQEAISLADKNTIIIDVRSKSEYEEKHIKGAINIPYNEIATLSATKDDKIILYCKSGARAKKAANELISLGFTKVYNLGAINNWPGEFE